MALDVKICGLKTEEAVAAALAGGASHIGFIFFAKSPRYISAVEAGLLRQPAYDKAKAVAVTVDANDTTLDGIVAGMQPDMLQLHGAETPAHVADIKARYRLPVMKAFAISRADDLMQIKPYLGVADSFLFDAKAPAGSDRPGGNGVSFDWKILGDVYPSVHYLLSGGLNAGNIAEALQFANPPGIDISSGVESAPGVKDVGLIQRFLAAVAAARKKAAA